ncbi:Zinc finger protein ush [Frankliniella fusca]|uniref:Zinc finger protein ush n=1 Tax=Frankliniella fusca TaxID=407009 RepID=A0AAE1LC31_9NEOP|nr:Zinc finger protein ush [Frankliniella fusca]
MVLSGDLLTAQLSPAHFGRFEGETFHFVHPLIRFVVPSDGGTVPLLCEQDCDCARPPVAALAVSRGLFLPHSVEAVAAAAALLPAAPPAAPAPAPPAAPAEPSEARQAVAFRCEPCGIRFSSLSTLEAHQTYYCSHRPNAQGPKGPIVEADEAAPGTDGLAGDLMAPRSDSADGSDSGKRPAQGGGPAAQGAGQAQGGNPGPGGQSSAGHPKQYSCPHCSYSADKKVSLNRHMRMHTASPPAATGAVAPPLQLQPAEPADAAASFVDRYCQDCDIRFSSYKTFRAHKQHYCSTRHVLKGSGAAGSSESASPSPVEAGSGTTVGPGSGPGPALPTRAAAGSPGHASNEPLLALPTNPPLLIPYSLVQAASVVQSGALSAALGVGAGAGAVLGAACLLWLPDGSLQPVATANLPSPGRPRAANAAPPQPSPSPSPQQPQAQPAPAAAVPKRQREAKQSSPNPGAAGAAPATTSATSTAPGLGPLDLSLRRASDCSEPDQDMDEDVHVQDHEHEDIVCAPSIPLMLSASSTCSSPSPAPPPGLGPSPSPPPLPQPPPGPGGSSRKRPHSPALSPTDRGGKKSPRRTPNGVVHSGAAAGLHAGLVKKETERAESERERAVAVHASGPGAGAAAVGPDPQLLLQSVLAGRGLSQGLAQGLAQGSLPLLLGNPLTSPLSANIELALRMAAVSAAELQQQVAPPPPPPPPQVHVKHGVSKCMECNIVFCRHENYLAHKRHYCQARLQEDAAPAEGGGGGGGGGGGNAPSPSPVVARSPSSSSPPETQSAAPAAPVAAAAAGGGAAPALTHVQYICARCHIKFTSLDNLTHHQAYYCPKRPQGQDAALPGPGSGKVVEDKGKRRCPKCKALVPADQTHSHQCDVLVVGSGWRCPCCPVTSPTISAAQRHIETHNGVRAFRCTLCGYKGNTLRGMRTHIRMHFEKGLPDLQEENYITCVMEDEAANTAPIPVPAPLATPPTPPAHMSALTSTTEASSLPGSTPSVRSDSDKQFNCDYCSFTSLDKSKLQHHFKHFHSRPSEENATLVSSNPSSTPVDQRLSNALNGANKVRVKQEKQDDDLIQVEEFKVKEEPVFISDVEERSTIKASPLLLEDSKSEEMNRDDVVSANNNKTGPKYCKTCDIKFPLYDSFMNHKKFYCTRSGSDSKVAQAH